MIRVVIEAAVLLGAGLGVFQMMLARGRRGAPGAVWVAVLGGLAAWWCTCYAVALGAPDDTVTTASVLVEFMAVPFVPGACLMAAVEFNRHSVGMRARVAVFAPAVMTVALAVTNPAHHWFLGRIVRDPQTGAPVIAREFLFLPFLAYSYVLVLMAVGTVLSFTPNLPRARSGIVPAALIAIGAPFGLNMAYQVGAMPGNLDFTCLGFAVTGTVLAYAILRLQLLDAIRGLIPAGRDELVRVMEEGILVLNRHGVIVDANPAATAFAGTVPARLLHQRHADVLRGWPSDVLDGPGSKDRIVALPGSPHRLFEVRAREVEARGGTSRGRMVVVRDVTEQVRARQALERSERRFRQLFENAEDIVFTADATGRITALNRRGRRLFGDAPATETTAALLGARPGTHADIPGLLERLGRDGGVVHETQVVARDGRHLFLEVGARLGESESGDPLIECIGRDVTERRLLEARLQHRAAHDPLTGLANRDQVREVLDGVVRSPSAAALLIVDLDHFKDVNDSLGHPVGDRVLCEIGPRLRACLPSSAVLGRLGGDEFAVVVPDAAHHEADAIGHRLLTALDPPFHVHIRPFALSASVGAALRRAGDDLDADELLRRADTALYAAKRVRRSVTMWSPEQGEGAGARLGMRERLRQAIATGELEVHYQPQVRLRDGGVSAAEALVRWRHPDEGLLLPSAFVPAAEEVGVVSELGRWVTARALDDCSRWHRAGHDVRVAVNLSPLALDDGLPRMIRDEAAAARLDPAWLKVELTETAIVRDLDRGGRLLAQVGALGTRIAIDDFGVGYSSLAHLRALPVSELKIDRLFVQNVQHDAAHEFIVRSVVSLGHELGAEVVAEGIEDAAGWDALRRMGCDLGQGFHVGPPMGADAFDAWLAAHPTPT